MSADSPATLASSPFAHNTPQTSIWEVARYLRREQPTALLAIKHRAMLAALRAKQLARTQTPISGRLGTTVSAALANKSARAGGSAGIGRCADTTLGCTD